MLGVLLVLSSCTVQSQTLSDYCFLIKVRQTVMHWYLSTQPVKKTNTEGEKSESGVVGRALISCACVCFNALWKSLVKVWQIFASEPSSHWLSLHSSSAHIPDLSSLLRGELWGRWDSGEPGFHPNWIGQIDTMLFWQTVTWLHLLPAFGDENSSYVVSSVVTEEAG